MQSQQIKYNNNKNRCKNSITDSVGVVAVAISDGWTKKRKERKKNQKLEFE